MGTSLDRPLLEGGKEPVGVAAVPLLRQDHNIDQVGHSAAQPVAQAPDPVTDLVAEHEVTLLRTAGTARHLVLLLDELGVPGCKVAVLFHFPDDEFAHGALPEREMPCSVRNVGASPRVPARASRLTMPASRS
jgi:hypothetical protein